MTDQQISFGDSVRIRKTPATQAAGVAGLTGLVYGETTPSITGVEVIGELRDDYAINVNIEDHSSDLWFTPDQLEFIDHAAGTEITLDGVDKKWVRTESGEWDEIPMGVKRKSFWETITGRVFNRKKR